MHYTAGIFVGLVVLGAGGKNNGKMNASFLTLLKLHSMSLGTVRGVQYFSCPPSKGLLVGADEICLLDTTSPQALLT